MQQRVDYLTRSGSGVDQILHPVDASGNPTTQHPGFWRTLGGIGAHIGDAALTLAAPSVALMTPGTTAHHNLLLNQAEGQEGQAEHELQAHAALQDSQAQASQRQYQAVQEAARAQALLTPKPSRGQLLYDKTGGAIGYQDGDGN
jgi:hypothetical protein